MEAAAAGAGEVMTADDGGAEGVEEEAGGACDGTVLAVSDGFRLVVTGTASAAGCRACCRACAAIALWMYLCVPPLFEYCHIALRLRVSGALASALELSVPVTPLYRPRDEWTLRPTEIVSCRRVARPRT